MKYIKQFENFETEDFNNSVSKELNIDKILDNYLEAAIWTNEEDLSKSYTIYDFDDVAKENAKSDIINFVSKAKEFLTGIAEEQIGHDFWLTRNHHGAGFWDRGYDENIGEKLTEISHEFKESTVVEDDGKLFLE